MHAVGDNAIGREEKIRYQTLTGNLLVSRKWRKENGSFSYDWGFSLTCK